MSEIPAPQEVVEQPPVEQPVEQPAASPFDESQFDDAGSAPTREQFRTEMRQESGFAHLEDDALDEMYEGLYPVAEGSEEPKAPEVPKEGQSLETPPPLQPEGFKVFVDDAEVEDLRGLTIEDLLTKAQLSYKAVGQEQRKSLAEVIRNAQLGHLKGSQMEALERDRDTLNSRLTELSDRATDLQQQSETWDYVMQQALLDNWKPMEDLLQRYQQQLGDRGQPGPSPEAQRLQQIELERAGQQVLDQEIRPYLQEVAKQYGIEDVAALENKALTDIGRIPEALMTAERVRDYLTRELLMELEATGGAPGAPAAPAAPAASPEVSQLQQTIEALQKQVAELTAGRRLENAPPPSGGSGGSPEGGGEEGDVPNFTNPETGEFDLHRYNEWLKER